MPRPRGTVNEDESCAPPFMPGATGGVPTEPEPATTPKSGNIEDRVAFLLERAGDLIEVRRRVTELETAFVGRDRELTDVFSHLNTVMQQLFRNQELLEWKISGLFHVMDPETYPAPGPNPAIKIDESMGQTDSELKREEPSEKDQIVDTTE